MEEIIKSIVENFNEFTANVEANKKGNKAAGTRARKNALNLMSFFKDFRKASVEKDKA